SKSIPHTHSKAKLPISGRRENCLDLGWRSSVFNNRAIQIRPMNPMRVSISVCEKDKDRDTHNSSGTKNPTPKNPDTHNSSAPPRPARASNPDHGQRLPAKHLNDDIVEEGLAGFTGSAADLIRETAKRDSRQLPVAEDF